MLPIFPIKGDDKTFLKSMVSDFFHFMLSVFAVGWNQFQEEKISLKTHHKVAESVKSSKKLKIVIQASAYVRL